MNNVKLSGVLSAEPKLMYETYNIDPEQEINIKKLNEKCVVWLKLENNGQNYAIGARGHLAVEMANVLNKNMNVSIQGVLDEYIDENNKTVEYIRATGYTILEKEVSHLNEINISGYISEPLNNREEYSFCTFREDKYSSKIYCVHISNELAKNLKEDDRVELQGTYQERHLTLVNGDHVLDKFIQADTCKVLESLKETSILGYIYDPYFENGELAGCIDENKEVTYYQTEDGLETYEGHYFYASGEVGEGLNYALHELTALREEEGSRIYSRIDRRLIRLTGNQEYIKHKGRTKRHSDWTESKLTVNSFEVMLEPIRMKKVKELGSAKIDACMNEYGYSSIKANFANWFAEKHQSSDRGDRTKEEARLEQVLYEKCTAQIEQCNAQNEQKRNRFIGMDLRGKKFTQKDLRDINLEGADLRGAKLDYVDMTRANLKDANLEGASLIGACLIGANLERANLNNANLEGANLYYTKIKDATLKNAYLVHATYDKENISEAKNLGRARLKENRIADISEKAANIASSFRELLKQEKSSSRDFER